MTESEVGKLLSVALAAYPEKTSGWNEATQRGLARAWTMVLSDYTYQEGSAALQVYLKSDKYNRFPGAGQIATIIDNLKDQADPTDITPSQAWAIVRPAISDSTYHSEEHFNKFPPDVQEAVGSPQQLYAWAQMPSDTIDSVVKSNFCNRDFPTIVKRRKEKERLPKPVKDLIEAMLGESKKPMQEIRQEAQQYIEEQKPMEEADHSDHGFQIAMLEEELHT